MRQVLHNLLKNALEAVGHDGEISIEIKSVTRNNAPFVQVAVYDNGPGISPENLEKIFDPYVTSKTKGTGLGSIQAIKMGPVLFCSCRQCEPSPRRHGVFSIRRSGSGGWSMLFKDQYLSVTQ